MKFPLSIKSFNFAFIIFLTSFSLLNNKLEVYAEWNSHLKVEDSKNKLDKIKSAPTIENYLREKNKDEFYILGPEDTFTMNLNELGSIDDVPSLGGTFKIDMDGYVNLPRLRRVKVSGLTIEELTQLLNSEYKKYLKNVDADIILQKYRPAKIYLDGEIANPGLHILMRKNVPPKASSFYNNVNPTPTGGSTLFDALRIAGGVSLNSDLTRIEITRINSLSNGGGRIKTNVNLLRTLDLKDTSQNISLRDGDTVFVPSIPFGEKPLFNKILKSNINPKFINVYISGRVNEPGIKKLFTASSLVDGIRISGGAKIVKGKVRFLRYKNDGTIDKRVFSLRNNSKRGAYNNPILKNGDIIFVGNSLLGATSEVLNEITNPFRSILSTYSFFKIISD